MKYWTWQKWLGKLAPIVVTLITSGVWEFIELPVPFAAGVIGGLITFAVQAIISLFPSKKT